MKIVHQRNTNFITFFPKGKFYSKVRTFLKLANYKLFSDPPNFEIKKTRSKKRAITYIPSLLKKSRDVVIIFKFKKSKKLRVSNDDNDPANFYYSNWLFNSQSYDPYKKLTKEHLIFIAGELILDKYGEMIYSFGLEYEFAPLHSIVLKFI